MRYPWLVLTLWVVPTLALSGPDDVMVRSEMLRITEVHLEGGYRGEVDFLRSTLHVDLGFGASTLGLLVQNATKAEDVAPGVVETGLMLTAGYDWILSSHLRLDAVTRIGLVETDPGNPLYATDTDLRLNLVAFSPDGAWAWNGRTGHPSAYVGSIVNRYGRVQLVAGAGAWWNQWGVYATGFTSLNGVKDPRNTTTDFDRRFAFLNNRGVSLSASYDLRALRLGVRRNFAARNGGNDLAVSVEWRHEFGYLTP